jgi:serine/threonine-protein kinase OSR1/STK39
MTLQNAPPGLDYERDKKFSKVSQLSLISPLLIAPARKFNSSLTFPNIFILSFQSFKQMIACCLVKDPSKRPSANRLLKHSFFKQARSSDYITRTLLEGLPALGDRMEILKVALLPL